MAAILNRVPELDYSSLTGKPCGKLRLTPEQLLAAIHAQELADWSLHMAYRFQSPRLARGPGGRPAIYRDNSILLMAVVQTVWRKSYEQIVDYVATHQELAVVLGFEGRTISQGVILGASGSTGHPTISVLLSDLGSSVDPPRSDQGAGVDRRFEPALGLAKRGSRRHTPEICRKEVGVRLQGDTVLCHQTDLPLFALVTPAHVHDSQVGWFVILVAALLFGLKVLVVYVDAAYFDKRMFWVVHEVLGAHPAIHYNLRKAGKKKLATLDFLDQWQRLVTAPRTAIERHFAWMKRYFGLKYFQCFTLVRVMQFIQLTYIAALAVALSAERYQCPDLHRRRSSVLAHL